MKQPRKIALIIGSSRPVPAVRGGATQTMMTHLIEQNETYNELEITVYSYYDKEASAIAKEYKNTKVMYYRGNLKWDFLRGLPTRLLRKLSGGRCYVRSNFVRWCITDIRMGNYDAVIVEGNYFQILQLKKALSNPIILHVHIDGLNIDTDSGKRILDACAGVFAISNYCKQRIVQIDPAQAGKVYVLKNMIDVEHFDISRHSKFRDVFRRQLGIQHHQKLIVFCGRVAEAKGVKELIQAFIELDDKNIFLAIIGSSVYRDGKKTHYYTQLVKIAEGCSRIAFLGYIPQKELPKYYAAADISVVPSKWQEAAGNVIPESMACNLPVIATRRGGIPEYADEAACILVDCNEHLVSNLVSALQMLITDQKVYEEKKSQARNVALQYDKTIYYRNFCDLVDHVLKGVYR